MLKTDQKNAGPKPEYTLLLIVMNYFEAKRRVDPSLKRFNSPDINIEEAKTLIKNVESSLDCLNEEEKNIINNEFFFQNYPFWWGEMYSRGQFIKLKRAAVEKFLKNYNGLLGC